MNIKSIMLSVVILGLSSTFVLAQAETNKAASVQVINEQTPASKGAVNIGNKICPVSGDNVPGPGVESTMGDKPITVEYKGKIYNLCCTMCVKDFKKNPEKYSAVAEKEVKKNK